MDTSGKTLTDLMCKLMGEGTAETHILISTRNVLGHFGVKWHWIDLGTGLTYVFGLEGGGLIIYAAKTFSYENLL